MRNNPYQRWRYIRSSVFGESFRNLQMAQQLLQKHASRMTNNELKARLKDLEDTRWQLWYSAHLALGLVVDEPDSAGRAKELLESAQSLVEECQQATHELGLGS